MSVPTPSSVLLDGPWTHRDVSANGARFHVAEAGDGPLVLLLHGFPQMWWAWRFQLEALAAAGYRAAAVDLRGYGASDKPPRGYDPWTLSADVAGLVRALGEQRAVLVGQDVGGLTAWATAALHPAVVRRLVVVSAAHPLRQRSASLSDPAQMRASAHLAFLQLPRVPERRLTEDDGAWVVELLTDWAAPGWPPAEVDAVYRSAVQIPGVAHCSVEYHRWLVRSLVRPDGLRFAGRMRRRLDIPVLQLHGALDSCVLPSTAVGSGRFVDARYEWRLVPGAGHFLAEEAADLVSSEIARWAGP